MRITIFTLYCLLSFCITPLIAQDYPDRSSNNYNSENGLPQNSVRTSRIDKNGYLWAATEMGLVRFDGSRFTWYNQNNTPLLLNNRINRSSLTN